MKCPVCNHDTWVNHSDFCEHCGITGQAIMLGPGRMRRISKRFRYLNAKKFKKRRKHGRAMPAPARLVWSRSRLRQSEAARIAARQAEMLRAAQGKGQGANRRSGLQDDVGRDS
jgi:hypothetical protein